MNQEEFTRMFKYMKAQKEAEKQGKREFACPICGGKAEWGRSNYNNHLHTWCAKCGIKIME